ncbi:hypothetical protein Glove_155g142 [Diversispora epigaea]|uniref:Uncharacterized protein n=1 Tax=Diversispora epigaea TaxID=1348612 RepID=A0A397IYP4_9GLOM|nr:hypothetical protein Glove_155g142 [Diversispora epigaea]
MLIRFATVPPIPREKTHKPAITIPGDSTVSREKLTSQQLHFQESNGEKARKKVPLIPREKTHKPAITIPGDSTVPREKLTSQQLHFQESNREKARKKGE